MPQRSHQAPHGMTIRQAGEQQQHRQAGKQHAPPPVPGDRRAATDVAPAEGHRRAVIGRRGVVRSAAAGGVVSTGGVVATGGASDGRCCRRPGGAVLAGGRRAATRARSRSSARRRRRAPGGRGRAGCAPGGSPVAGRLVTGSAYGPVRPALTVPPQVIGGPSADDRPTARHRRPRSRRVRCPLPRCLRGRGCRPLCRRVSRRSSGRRPVRRWPRPAPERPRRAAGCHRTTAASRGRSRGRTIGSRSRRPSCATAIAHRESWNSSRSRSVQAIRREPSRPCAVTRSAVTVVRVSRTQTSAATGTTNSTPTSRRRPSPAGRCRRTAAPARTARPPAAGRSRGRVGTCRPW